MIDKITVTDAQKLNTIWSLSYELLNLCEDMRPAGGWDERVDESKFCSKCGKKVEK